jgi:hypothetical protein
MTISELDQLVLAAESEVQAIQTRAEQIVDDLKKSMPSHLEEMANKIVSNTIEENPKGVTDLGDKVKDLKKQIVNVTATFPNEVSTKLDSNVKWAHKQSNGAEKETYKLKDTLTKEMTTAINDIGRLILGKIGSLLIENKVAKLSDRSYWKTENSSSVIFSYGMGFYHQLEKTKFQKDEERYISIIDEYVKALKKLDTARDNKNKAEARKFWDEA